MASYILNLPQEQNITLSAAVVRRLIECGNGDAALLYLCLAQNNGRAEHDALCKLLRWTEPQLRAAEGALSAAGLIKAQDAPKAPPAVPLTPADRPSYTRTDVREKLEQDETFSSLLHEVERKLGPLSTPSTEKLLGLYDHLGLGADVIFLLVNYCIERCGEGRLPVMRQIEQEGYAWARRELFTTSAANEYLKREREKRSRFPDYMKVLRLGERECSESEGKYLSSWLDMGFPPETVAIAYDKTVLRCHEFKWGYCNGILKKWHEKGLHAPEEVSSERKAAPRKPAGKNDWMKEYIEKEGSR